MTARPAIFSTLTVLAICTATLGGCSVETPDEQESTPGATGEDEPESVASSADELTGGGCNASAAANESCTYSRFMYACGGTGINKGRCFSTGCCCPVERQCRSGSFPVCCPSGQKCVGIGAGGPACR